ncbi:uncharacterized protein BJ171DRAFT_490351 [Polychytrium aggregatum]|uniref:uncharacterized protein n=1 Tax=Polychytrium aggregatum TaxID=110093 RepID=UPI0022FDB6C4|nr:uncharacterized protein BJ171DRAFT_490351 [Polychytrium aggregatum]KAI9208143.1 hypothetical protein BJ171DRAFT_490351 [Polychytrium aggregatum]
MDLQPTSRALRLLTAAVLSATLFALFPFATSALKNGTGLPNEISLIVSNVWSLCTLADYITGMSLVLPYLVCLGPTPWTGTLWCILELLLGTPVLLIRGIARLALHSTVAEAIVPFAAGTATSPNRPGTVLLRWSAGLLAVVFTGVCSYALATESISVGWGFIRTHPSSLLLFALQLSGVLFTAMYIWIRERNNLWMAIPTLILLVFLGNVVTAVYVLLASIGATSVQDALLVRRSVLGRSRRFYYEQLDEE